MAESDSKQVATDSSQSRWLGFGLLMFGVVNGLTTGLSETAGTAQTLLTSLSAFVGGSLLTFAGFMRPRADGEKPQIDSRRVGIGISCFSIGILLGLFPGMELRKQSEASQKASEELEAPEPPDAPATVMPYPVHVTCGQAGAPTPSEVKPELAEAPKVPDEVPTKKDGKPNVTKADPGYSLHENKTACEAIAKKIENDWLGVSAADRAADKKFWSDKCQPSH